MPELFREKPMTSYVALLRGINVAGHKLIKMDHLASIFTAAGFCNVRTYIQSGNVIFDSRSTNSELLAARIERLLKKTLGHDIPVMVRKVSDIRKLVRRDPFPHIQAGTAEAMPFVVFLRDTPLRKPKLPLVSNIENLEVFEIRDGAALILLRRKPNGSVGSPNAFIEKELGVRATTRNWNTIKKILTLAGEKHL